MAARDSETKADAGKPGEGSKAKGGGGRGRPPPDAVARAMAEVERTLDRLKQMRAERAEAEAKFKSELEARDAEIAALRAHPGAGAARLAEVEGRLAGLQAVSEEAGAVESERDAALAKLEEVGRRLGEVEAALGAERKSRELAESTLAEAEGAARSRVEQLREQLTQAEERERGLGDTRDRERHEAEATIQELTDRLAAAEAAAADQVAGLRRAVESLESRAAAAETARSELQARLADAERRMGEAGQGANAEIQSLRAKAVAIEAERDEARSQAASARAELEAKLGEAEHRLGQAEADTDALIARITELEAALSARAGEAEGALRNASILDAKVAEQEAEIGRVRGALEAAHAAVAERDTRLAAGDASAQEELAKLRAEIERRGTEATGLLEALKAAQRESEALAASGAEASAAVGAARAEAEAQAQAAQAGLHAALDAERAQVRELTNKLDMAADRLVEMQTTLDEQARALEQSGEVGRTAADLTRELHEVRARLADVERERDAAVAGGGNAALSARWDDARVAGRRERLRRCRELLRERAQQAARAARVLEQKSQKCDELLARRRELVEARQVIERTHKKVVSARAKSGAGAAVFFGLAIITVLSGLSWAVVTRIFPATYAAAAVVSADFQGVAVKPGEIEAWQAFHEELARDPNLMSRVAERMAQRGFIDLGQPAVVKTMVDADMTVTSPKDGVLAFELRGLGQDATARKLDTFVTTLVAEANALRQRRTDPSTTIVSERARAGVDPIEDPRLEYAGMGIGVGGAFAFLLWFGIWRRMVKSKHAFEHETEIEGLLEESRWVDPIQQIIEARVDGTGNRAA